MKVFEIAVDLGRSLVLGLPWPLGIWVFWASLGEFGIPRSLNSIELAMKKEHVLL